MRALRGGILALLLAATALAALPGHAGRRMSDRYAVRATIHRYLVRLGHLQDGPHYAQSMRQVLEEMVLDVGPFHDLAIEYLGGFLRNPETDFDECTVTQAMGPFGGQDPQQAVRVLIRGLPTRNVESDTCVGKAMRQLGPPAYPWLVRCAEVKGDPEIYWCLDALLDQSRHLADIAEKLAAAEPRPDSARSEIQRWAGQWETWYEKRAAELEWDPETQLLQEREP